MTYNIDRIIEFPNLMPALGLGFILGFLYDIIRILRLCVSNGKVFVFITDALYIVTAVLSSYLLFLSVNFGRIRAYLVISIVIGAVIYSCTAGELIYRFFKKLTDRIKKILKKIFSPFMVLFSKIKHLFGKLKKKFNENLKNLKNKLKKTLKHADDMLYNNTD